MTEHIEKLPVGTTIPQQISAVGINHSGLTVSLKLTRDNFLLWRTQILPVLAAYEVTDHIEKDPPEMSSLNKDGQACINLAYKIWFKTDKVVLAIINSSLTESTMPIVVGKETAKEAWDAIIRNFAGKSQSRIMELQTKLHNLRKNSMSVEAYVQIVRTLGDELRANGSNINMHDLSFALLRGLDQQYNAFYASTSQLLHTLTFDDVVANLITFDSHLARQNNDHTTGEFPPSAHFTQINNQDQRNNRGGRNNRGRGRGQRTIPRCQLCFKQGHRVINCYERFNKDFLQPNYKETVLGQQSRNVQPQANLANMGPYQGNPNTWYPDSGSTHHVTNDSNNIQNPAIYTGPDQLYVGNGQGLHISSTGSSSFHSNSAHFKLNNILHVPSITKNLLFIHKFTRDNNVYVEFHPNFCVVKDIQTRQPLMRGEHKDGPYLLHFLQNCSSYVGEKASPNTWHHRLGHPHFRVLQSILNKYGLPLTHKLSHLYCDACRTSKSHKLPFTISVHKSSKPLELIHSDVWGPAPILSHFGFSYYVVFIDDFSKYTWLFPLRKKSDVLSTFIEFKKKVENQFSTRIVSFQSDWGGEFQALTTYLKEHGIHHRVSCPYTSEQNGTAERKHRHLVETALALLKNASLPEKFWDEAVSTAAYLINRMITPLLHNKSPYEIIFNILPDYKLLRTFGCLCYPHLRPYSLHKLDTRSEKCIFLGYSSIHLGYRCLSISSNKLFISRDVVFEESIFPYSHSSTSSDNTSTGILGTHPTPLSITVKPYVQNTPISTSFPATEPIPPDQNIITSSHESSNSEENDRNIPSADPISPDTTSFLNDQNLHSADPISPDTTPPLKTKSISEIYSKTQPITNHPLPECFLTNTTIPCEPISFSQAMKDAQWLQAMKTEFIALKHNQTWKLVPRSTFMNVINCKWVFKLKHKYDGSIERYKARLVAKGFKQEDGFDYDETFSPVIKITTVRILLSLAISQRWLIHQLDVSNAFLHGELQETIFMEQPPGFVNTALPNHVCQLNKSLYGLKQAPRTWFLKLSTYLLSLGFSASKTDTSLFFKYHNNIPYIFLIYVDDILLIIPDSAGIKNLISSLSSTFSMRDLGPAHYFLGIEFISTPTGYFLSQSKYLLSILQKAHMDIAKPTSNPCSFSKSTDFTKFHDPTLYRSIVGALQYLTITRPDISFSVNEACQVMHSPTHSDWTSVKHLLRYLKNSISDGLFYSRTLIYL